MSAAYEQRPYAVPPDATEVILVRHGASAAVVAGEPFELLDGRGDPPLSDVGERQAEAVAERLAREPLAAVFTSTLRRTHQTAAPLVRRVGLEPVALADLCEVCLGDWEGGEFRVREREGDALVAQVLAEERWDVIANAEPAPAFAERVRRGVAEIVSVVGSGALAAAFVHGAVIGELGRQATLSRPFAFIRNDNASITRLVVHGDGTLLLRSFNDTAHLA